MVLSNIPVLVAKAAFAVMVAFMLARELTPSDVLSATFVSILCISPTLYTGLRRGGAQLAASALGGLATLAVMIPLEVSPWTLGLAMSLGLGAAFLVGFSTTFTVSGFTVLYVALIGRAEVDAYFVRLSSVLLGVAVGALANLIGSAFLYRQIFGRRVGIAARAVERPMTLLAHAVATHDVAALRRADEGFGPVFRLLAELTGEFQDLRRELRLRRDVRGQRLRTALQQERVVERLELISHYGRDIALLLRELLREPEGQGDADSIGVAAALGELSSTLQACAARLSATTQVLPTAVRSRYDPMLRRLAARVAEGEEGEDRLELMLGIVVDLENLYGACARLVDLTLELVESEGSRSPVR